jgi:hypothetical protein
MARKMTAGTWAAVTDPSKLLHRLREDRVPRFKKGRRKLRLFACACCRRLWDRLPGEPCRQAVEINERHADGLAGKADLAMAREAVAREIGRVVRGGPEISQELTTRIVNVQLGRMVQAALQDETWHAAAQAASWGVIAAAQLTGGVRSAPAAWTKAWHAERRAQCDLLRDVFGNPFRPPAVQHAWLRWNDGTIPRLARAIYDDRAFNRLGILADALEDAGCTDVAILKHCRQPAEHVRGCWLVDLLLQQG